MTMFTESLGKLADIQKQGFEPVRRMTGVAVEAFESLARKNYEVFGDVLDFAVSQARLPIDLTNPKDLLEKQIAGSKAFAELLKERAGEYVVLGMDVQEAAMGAFAEPAKKTAGTKTKKSS